MSPTGGVAIYFILWWVVLLAVLPFGVRTIEESGELEAGQSPSAPARPHLLRKFVVTTLIALVLWAILFVVMEYRLVSLDDLPLPAFPE